MFLPDGARMKINFFTPLPPARTEIANHSVSVLAELAPHGAVTVWTPQDYWRIPSGIDVQIRQFSADTIDYRDLNAADISVYNIGNNPGGHLDIFKVMHAAPGICILHDTYLQHLFVPLLQAHGASRDLYMRLVAQSEGARGLAAVQAFLDGAVSFEDLSAQNPMTGAACAGQLAIVTHNPAETAPLRHLQSAPVFELPLAIPDRGPVRPLPRGDHDPLRLIMFGHLGSNRCIDSILRAVAALPRPQRVRLDIYGRVARPDPVTQLIAELGIGRQVTLHGFVSDQQLDDALLRADLALNLRFPSMGEASASQLRIWMAGLPSLVTRIGWYATVPDDTVFMVDPGAGEVPAITGLIERMLESPAPFIQAGARGQRHARAHHTPGLYAAGLLALLRQLPVLQRRRRTAELAEITADTMALLFAGHDTATLGRTAAQAIRDVAAIG